MILEILIPLWTPEKVGLSQMGGYDEHHGVECRTHKNPPRRSKRKRPEANHPVKGGFGQVVGMARIGPDSGAKDTSSIARVQNPGTELIVGNAGHHETQDAARDPNNIQDVGWG